MASLPRNRTTDEHSDGFTRRSWLKHLCVTVPLLGGCIGHDSSAIRSGDPTLEFGYGGRPLVTRTSTAIAEQVGSLTAATTDSSGTQYSQSIPGRIQAEDFDKGGEDVAYHDTTDGNAGGTYRESDVDIQPSDDSDGTHNVGWIEDEEWLEYTLQTAAGTYDVNVRVASPDGGSLIRLSLDGEVLGTVSVPATGAWQNWQTVTLNDVRIPEDAEQTLRLTAVGGEFNVNWLEFSSTDSQSPFGGQRHALPGTVQAEDFDVGGEGVAYHDTTVENQGGAYRDTESVDMQTTTNGYNVGWIKDGEWLEYAVTVEEGTYDVQMRVASPYSGGKCRVSLDGTAIGTVAVPNTEGWQQWSTITLTDINLSSSGDRSLRLDVLSGAFNLDWIRVVSGDTTSSLPDDYGDHAYGQGTYGGVVG